MVAMSLFSSLSDVPWLAIAVVAISIASFYAAHRQRERLKKTATLKVVVETQDGGNHWIVIQNDGQAAARDVAVTLRGRPIVEWSEVLDREEARIIGGCGSKISYQIIFPLQSELGWFPIDCRVEWNDGVGHHAYEHTLTPRRHMSSLLLLLYATPNLRNCWRLRKRHKPP